MLQTQLRQVRRLRLLLADARAALALLIWLIALPTGAADSIQIQTNYYRVRGDTARAIRSCMETNRPWKGRAQRDASTTWDIRWQVRSSSQLPAQIVSFETQTRITVTLPLWITASNAPPTLRTSWQRYFRALNTHEEGHKRIALAAAKETRSRVEQLGSADSQEELRRSIESTVDAVIAEFRNKEAEYDRTTKHGETQGARFP